MRWVFLTGLVVFGACLCACGTDLNPQPEPPGGDPVTTSGAATGSTGVGTGTTATSGAGGATVGTGGTGSGGGGGGGGAPNVDAAADTTGQRDAGGGASDAGGDTRDASSTPDGGDGGAFPACSFVDTLDHRCAADSDCVVGVHQTDCCGNTSAIGLNRSDGARFDSSEQTCAASYPGCGCPSGPTRTDSGETAIDAMTIHVGCVTSGPTKECRTYVLLRPPDTP